MTDANALPSLAAVIGPLLQRVPSEHQPLFLAIAERMAAVRYREWAASVSDASQQAQLLACANREEEIAGRVESLHPDAARVQAGIRARHPDLDALNRDLFAGRSLPDQWAMQAQGERAGASTWKAFAERADGAARETFQACVALEEESAAVLDELLAAR